jgi:membrane protease YdiL (CAAX protease family)
MHPSASGGRKPVAPAWHTALLVALIVSVAVTGTLLTRHSTPPAPLPAATGSPITHAYLPLAAVEWALFAYVTRVGVPRGTLGDLLGEVWRHATRGAADVAIGIAAWLGIVGVECLVVLLFGASPAAASTAALLPHSALERLAWVGVAVSAGVCEEVVYRGYLQRQFRAFFGRPEAAILLQGLLFGVAHADQGVRGFWRLTLYGTALGVVAWKRRSLLPGIVCHVWTDIASGLFAG